jgi:hypothetical protein
VKYDGSTRFGTITKSNENRVWNMGWENGFLLFVFSLVLILFLDSSALRIYKIDDIDIDSGGKFSSVFNRNNEYKFGDNSIVDVEVDMNKKTIHYFINNNLCPYYHFDISSSSLLFGINAVNSKGIIEIICVKKMKRSSVNPCAKCEGMKWKKVLFFLYFVYYYFRNIKNTVSSCYTYLDKFIYFNK